MPYIPNNNAMQGLTNFIVGVEVSLYDKPLHREDIDPTKSYSLCLQDMGHKKLHWTPYKVNYTPNCVIISTKEVMVEACKQLNNIKENHAS